MLIRSETPLPKSEREICERFAQSRAFERISQSELAAKLESTRPQIANIERGRVALKFGLGWKACRLLNLNPFWLATGADANHPFFDVSLASQAPPEALFSEVCLGMLKQQLALRSKHHFSLAFNRAGRAIAAEPYVELIENLLNFAAFDLPAKARWGFLIHLAAAVEEFKKTLTGEELADSDAAVPQPEQQQESGSPAKAEENLPVDTLRLSVNSPGVLANQLNLASLLARVKRATEQPGKKSALANWLRVPLPRVSEWLNEVHEPGAEITLQLLNWVNREEERQQKTKKP